MTTRDHGTRYGNAVEIYGGCDGYVVDNNYIYQIYDTGVTHQLTHNSSYRADQKNIKYINNVFEYCNWSIEYWMEAAESNPSVMQNILIDGNYMWYAGKGFSSQRNDKDTPAHIMTWNHHRNAGSNIRISNNLMYDTALNMLAIHSDQQSAMPKFSNNRFAYKDRGNFGYVCTGEANVQRFDTNIVKYMDPMSTNDTFWFYE